MIEEPVERRLEIILASDIAGYSRLIGQDAAGTRARIRARRRELIDLRVSQHKGRIVKMTGDDKRLRCAGSGGDKPPDPDDQ